MGSGPGPFGSLEEEYRNKAKTLSLEIRRFAVSRPHDWAGASAGYAFLIAAKMIEKEFGIESPPYPMIEDGID